MKARQITDSTIKRLHTLSGNECAAPDCSRPLIARDRETLISKICHIEAASENGPRFNADMDDDERRHFSNLIVLCDECHSIIDNKENERKYPVSLLKKWKENHENKSLVRLSRRPSLLKMAINAIADAEFDAESDHGKYPKTTQNLEAFNIENKIESNCIRRNKPLIDNYKIFYSKINSLYDELEEQGSFKKNRLLRTVNTLYLRAAGNYIENSGNQIQAIRENADTIIEDIEKGLYKLVEKGGEQIFCEDISFGISIIMVDAFMRCKILEKPIKK